MTDYAQTYGALRSRVSDLVRGADEEQLERHTPAAPEWRVRDVVAHLSGITADINAGNLDGVATDAWTARQVDARRDWSIEQMLEEWDTEGAKVEAMMASLPEVAVGQMTTDAATHEQDIRGGLERPGARDCDAIVIGFDWGVQILAGRFELFRAMTGRRSLDQIRSFGWEGEPAPELLVLPIFTPRPAPLVE